MHVRISVFLNQQRSGRVPAEQRQQAGANVLMIDPALDLARDFMQTARAGLNRDVMQCLFHGGLVAGGKRSDSMNYANRTSSMKKRRLLIVLTIASSLQANAGEAEVNRGDDPFLHHVSNAIANCAAPRGPVVETEQEWLDEAHYRIEHGNSCWIAGRCRLSNSYLYGKEIAESVTRRLNSLNAPLPISAASRNSARQARRPQVRRNHTRHERRAAHRAASRLAQPLSCDHHGPGHRADPDDGRHLRPVLLRVRQS